MHPWIIMDSKFSKVSLQDYLEFQFQIQTPKHLTLMKMVRIVILIFSLKIK